MYAVIETGGKQFKVAEGDILRVEKLDGDKGSSIEFDKILLLEQDGQVRIGRPYVEGVKVTAKVLAHYKKKSGHRQPFTEIKIESIIA